METARLFKVLIIIFRRNEICHGSWGDQLTSFNGASITYDAIGNPLRYYNGAHFGWTGRMLTSATKGGKSLTFAYDDGGVRYTKTVAGVETNYYYDGNVLLAEQTGNIGISYFYSPEGAIEGFIYYVYSAGDVTATTYWYERNNFGDVIAIRNSAGAVLVEYAYDPYGNILSTVYKNGGESIAAVVNNSILYRGYYFDRDLGLYYLISRYYDPNTGRFISPDHLSVIAMSPTELTDKNLYAYCDNNPIMRIDATGNSWTVVRIVAGAALNVLTSYLGSLITGEEYTWKDVALDALVGAVGNAGKYGIAIAGTLDAIATGIETYMEGQTVGKSISIATVKLAFNFITIGNASYLLRDKTVAKSIENGTEVFIDIFANLVFDSPSSMLSAAVSRAIKNGG